jgi:anti-sigma factor RsiW
MSASCQRVRGELLAYGREELSLPDRRAVREHLAACAACRAEAASTDPVLLFAGLPAAAVSSIEVASVVASVRAGIALRQAERRIEGLPVRSDVGKGRGRALRAAAAAAVVVLTMAVPSGLRSPDTPEGAGAVTGAPREEFSSVAGPEGAVKASAGATVYDWNPGAGEPRVVWIVDGSLDI